MTLALFNMDRHSPPKPQRTVKMVGKGNIVQIQNISSTRIQVLNNYDRVASASNCNKESTLPGKATLEKEKFVPFSVPKVTSQPSKIADPNSASRIRKDIAVASSNLPNIPILGSDSNDIQYPDTESLGILMKEISTITPTEMDLLSNEDIKSEPIDYDSLYQSASKSNESNLEVDAALVERSLDKSLPEVVSGLSNKQRGQTNELVQLQTQLSNANIKYKNLCVHLKFSTEEVLSATRHVFLVEDDIIKANREISRLGSEVEKTIEMNNRLLYDITCNVEKIKSQEKIFQNYKKKINEYVQSVLDTESSNFSQAQLRLREEKLQRFYIEKYSIQGTGTKNLADSFADELQLEIALLKQEKEELDKQVQMKEQEVDHEASKQDQIKQEIEVLHKRNTAQLLCLKRQLKEIQTRNKQWNEQASELEHKVTELQNKLQ